MAEKKYVVYLGCPGFPYGLAEIQKIILISKSLVFTGNHVTVINNKGEHNQKNHPDLQVTGEYQGIEYVYTSGEQFRNPDFIKRNILKIKGIINEFLFLRKRKKENKLDVAILSTHSFNAVLYYRILSRIIGFKVILNYVEFYSGVKKSWNQPRKWANDELFDKVGPSLSDGILPISEFLINHLNKVVPGKPYLKIPGLTEFERYNGIEIKEGPKYFLFCGAASYREVIEFVIDAYSEMNNTSIFLYIVTNGTAEAVNGIKDYANSKPQKDFIKFFSKLSEKDLFTNYKNASALLIPLRNTFQDIARFPHKFGEYLGSGNPVITTNYGEVRKYFRDKENMLIAETYDVKQYAEKMQYVLDNPAQVKQIGINGRQTALPLFDYKAKAPEIDEFIALLKSKR